MQAMFCCRAGELPSSLSVITEDTKDNYKLMKLNFECDFEIMEL